MITDIDNGFQTGGEGSVINAPLFFQRAKNASRARAAAQVAILHFTYISIPLIIILKWKRILCWSANLMNYRSRLLLSIIKAYFINIQVCHASNNEGFGEGYFLCAS